MSKPLATLSWVFITLLAVLLGTIASSAANAQIAMKIAHVVPGDAPRGRGASRVAQLVTDDHRCAINAKVYPSAQLGGDTDLIEGLQIGSVEMVILPGSFLVGFQPLIGILDFPFFLPPEWYLGHYALKNESLFLTHFL